MCLLELVITDICCCCCCCCCRTCCSCRTCCCCSKACCRSRDRGRTLLADSFDARVFFNSSCWRPLSFPDVVKFSVALRVRTGTNIVKLFCRYWQHSNFLNDNPQLPFVYFGLWKQYPIKGDSNSRPLYIIWVSSLNHYPGPKLLL